MGFRENEKGRAIMIGGFINGREINVSKPENVAAQPIPEAEGACSCIYSRAQQRISTRRPAAFGEEAREKQT